MDTNVTARFRLTLLAVTAAMAIAAATTLATCAWAGAPDAPNARGRTLVRIGGCNDCQTSGYPEHAGAVPEQESLTGDALGWQGPWGTTYAPNLRRFVRTIDEGGFLRMARTRDFRPPMPAANLRAFTDAYLRAIHRYLRVLGPAGAPARAWIPPGQPVAGPVVRFPAPAQ